MTERGDYSGNVVLRVFAGFFEQALKIRTPYMRLLIVFVFALLVCVYLFRDRINPLASLFVMALVLIVFAFLAAALEYAQKKLRYSEWTGEQLKIQLREVATELAEEKSRNPLIEKDKGEGKCD